MMPAHLPLADSASTVAPSGGAAADAGCAEDAAAKSVGAAGCGCGVPQAAPKGRP